MKRLALAFALIASGWIGNLGATDPSFRFFRPVELPTLDEQELLAITLDDPIYAATRNDFSDLRLLDSDNSQVPFLLRTAAESRFETQRSAVPVTQQSAKPLPDGGLEITLAIPDDSPPISGVRILSPLRDFEHRVSVFASDGDQGWTLLADDGMIFDYSRFIDMRNEEVAFAETPAKRLRLVIDDVTDQQESRLLQLGQVFRAGEEGEESERTERVTIERRPFRVNRLECWSEKSQQKIVEVLRTPFAVKTFRVSHDDESRETLVEIETLRQPLTRLEIETPSRNFSRMARVEVPQTVTNQTRWRTLARASLSHLDFKDLQRSEVGIAFPESRHDQYRLVIENGDSPALEITGVTAEGTVREMVFLEPSGATKLVYGSSDAKGPSYDTAAIVTLLARGFEPREVTLGREFEETANAAGSLGFADLINNRWLLLGVMGLLIVLIAWFLYQAVQRVDELSPPSGLPADKVQEE